MLSDRLSDLASPLNRKLLKGESRLGRKIERCSPARTGAQTGQRGYGEAIAIFKKIFEARANWAGDSGRAPQRSDGLSAVTL